MTIKCCAEKIRFACRITNARIQTHTYFFTWSNNFDWSRRIFHGKPEENSETAQRLLCHYDMPSWTARFKMAAIKWIFPCLYDASVILPKELRTFYFYRRHKFAIKALLRDTPYFYTVDNDSSWAPHTEYSVACPLQQTLGNSVTMLLLLVLLILKCNVLLQLLFSSHGYMS